MKQLDYHHELKQIIASKQLVELDLPSEQDVVAYVLRVSNDFITLAEVSASATLLAVSTHRLSDVERVRVNSIYLNKLSKQLPGDSLYQTAVQSIENMTGCGFDDFIQSFAGTKTLIEVIKEDGSTFQGRIVAYNEHVIAVDEYYSAYDQRFAQIYINRDIISGLAVNTPRLRILEQVIADNSL